MGTKKGRLFELARTHHAYRSQHVREKKSADKEKPVVAKGEHFDEGKSISLSYSIDMYPEVLYDSHERLEPVSQMSIFDDLKSEAFFVESFDAEETVDVSYHEARDDDDAKLEKMVRGFGNDDDSMDDVSEKMKDMEGKMDDFLKDDESFSMEATDPGGISKKKTEDIETAHNELLQDESSATRSKEEIKSYAASDEEFARDLGAILKGQKVYDAEQKSLGRQEERRPSARREESGVQAKSADVNDMLDPNKDEHRIFEQIAKSMTYANSYDLGSISLSEKFELMDQEIEKEAVNKILTEKRNQGIRDAEDIEGEMSAASSNLSPEVTGEPSVESVSMGFDKYDPAGTLDNKNGGRLIKENILQKGDLILTTSSGSFDVIDGLPGSESIAGIYTGNSKLLTKGDGGVLEEKTLAPHIGNKGVMVALRHQGMSMEKASAIVESLTKLRPGPEKSPAENWVKINCPAISPHPDVCNADDVSDKKKCGAYAGKIYLGTMNNDSFSCAESIINAFEKSQIGFVPLLSKEHNGSLKYLGHLKNKA